MKRFLGLVLALIGGAISLWAGSSLLLTHTKIAGYDPVYAGLLGLAVFTVGVVYRQD